MKKLLFLLLITNCSLLITNAQWVEVSNGMGNQIVSSLAANVNTIFAGTIQPGNGVYLSTNNGTNWTQTSLNNRDVRSLSVNGNNIFAGTDYGYGVYLSTNNGTNWTWTSLDNQTVWALAVNGNNIYAGTGSGVYLSTNNGTNWTQTGLNYHVWSLAVNGSNVFAGTYGQGVYLSTNNGTSWTQTSLGYPQDILSLAINGTSIFAGAETYGVYLSTNNGTNWNQTSLNNRDVLELAVNGTNNVFAGTYQNGVYVSSNNGTSWTPRNEGLGNGWVFAFCILNNYIFAGTAGNSVYRRPLGELTGIQPILNEIPNQFSLSQNYPNPFNPKTIINFQLSMFSNVQLKIYDVSGKEVSTLVNEQLSPGTYEVDFDGSRLSSGVYYYKLVARQNAGSLTGDYTETKKMILVK